MRAARRNGLKSAYAAQDASPTPSRYRARPAGTSKPARPCPRARAAVFKPRACAQGRIVFTHVNSSVDIVPQRKLDALASCAPDLLQAVRDGRMSAYVVVALQLW